MVEEAPMEELADKQALAQMIYLAQAHFGQVRKIEQLKGDGSERKIFRLLPQDESQETVVGVIHHDLRENGDFFRITRAFQQAGLKAPEIIAIADDRTSYLLQDLGQDTLADCLVVWKRDRKDRPVLRAYQAVLDNLVRIQSELPRHLGDFLQARPMDQEVFRADLAYFKRDYLDRFGYADVATRATEKELALILDEMSQTIDDGCFVYRDLQARNIMWFRNQPWFIDYQSAFIGPRYYDLASLLYGSRSGLSEPERAQLLPYYFGLVRGDLTYGFDRFAKLFLLFVIMRRLRSLGTYGFLSGEKGRIAFFDSIAPSLNELRSLLHNQPALKPFDALRNLMDCLQDSWARRSAEFRSRLVASSPLG